ncbi:MAG TPA: hypothetical protein VK851_11845 [Anaerolineales bacterium]|nr:hypothetical protein [Anaerolineales bacterium]
MNQFGKFLAGVCVILFIFSGVVAIMAFNIERKAFSAETYKQAFENQNLHERMPAALAVMLSTSGFGGGSADALLGVLATEGNIATLLPPQELKTTTDNVLDATFAYLNGETDSAVVSIVSLKSYLANEGGVAAVNQMLDARPDCTLDQIAQITIGLLSGEGIFLCDPPEELMGLVMPLIQTQLQSMLGAFPDQITIISGEKSNTADDPRLRLNRLRAYMQISPVLPIMLLPLIVIFAVRTFKDWLQWWGWPLLTTGLISLTVALLGSPIVEWVVEQVMQVQLSVLIPPILLGTLRQAAGEIARQILNPVAIQGLVLSAAGLGMIVFAMILTSLERSRI